MPPPGKENFLLSSNGDTKHTIWCLQKNSNKKDPSTIYEMREAIFKRVCCPRLKSWSYCRNTLTITVKDPMFFIESFYYVKDLYYTESIINALLNVLKA